MEKDLKECTERVSRNRQSFFFRTDCYWPVSKCRPPPPLRLFFSHWQGWGWIEKRQFFGDSTSAEIVLHKTDRESQKNLSHRFLLSRKTAAAWAAMPFTTLTDLTSWSLWGSKSWAGANSKSQRVHRLNLNFSVTLQLITWFLWELIWGKLHPRDVTMKLKLSSTQPTFCLSPLSPPPALLWQPAHRPTLKCLTPQVMSDQGHQGYSLH